jgi:hypothetical protein
MASAIACASASISFGAFSEARHSEVRDDPLCRLRVRRTHGPRLVLGRHAAGSGLLLDVVDVLQAPAAHVVVKRLSQSDRLFDAPNVICGERLSCLQGGDKLDGHPGSPSRDLVARHGDSFLASVRNLMAAASIASSALVAMIWPTQRARPAAR